MEHESRLTWFVGSAAGGEQGTDMLGAAQNARNARPGLAISTYLLVLAIRDGVPSVAACAAFLAYHLWRKRPLLEASISKTGSA